jgi:hypothetical protein
MLNPMGKLARGDEKSSMKSSIMSKMSKGSKASRKKKKKKLKKVNELLNTDSGDGDVGLVADREA